MWAHTRPSLLGLWVQNTRGGVNCVLLKFSRTACLTDLAGWSWQNKRQILRKIKNTRIFTWKTFCSTKVKNHDLPPVGFSLSTITGKHGYNVTHLVTSNSRSNVQHLWTLKHTSLSHLDSDNSLTLQKNEFSSFLQTLLSQANCKDNQRSNDFAKTLNNLITLTKY